MDFNSILDSYNQNGQLPPGIVALQCGFCSPIFRLENRPGFYFIPGVLSTEEQSQWIRESSTSFPQPPNRTNHNAFYGPIDYLFDAVKEKKVLVEDESSIGRLDLGPDSCVSNGGAHRWKFYEEGIATLRGKTCKSVTASVLLRKLTGPRILSQDLLQKFMHVPFLGIEVLMLQNYDVSLPHKKIPDALCQLAKRLAAPAMPRRISA